MVTSSQHGLAFVFPGQGSQRSGMAKKLLSREAEARKVFKQAGEIIGRDLSFLCSEGSDAELTRTEIAQPALFTTSAAWFSALKSRGLVPQSVAAHSLGEFSAWVAADVMSFESGLRLVRRRAELMEDAARRNPGGMLAVIGLDDDKVESICRRARRRGVVVPANWNSPGQVVVSGQPQALDYVADLVRKAHGRPIPLRVSGAFHSPLMEDAALLFSKLVEETELRDPAIPVVANATGTPVTTAEEAREAMKQQMTAPVLWTMCVRRMVADGAHVFVEVGPGRVLTGLIKRIAPHVLAVPVGGRAALDELIPELRQWQCQGRPKVASSRS